MAWRGVAPGLRRARARAPRTPHPHSPRSAARSEAFGLCTPPHPATPSCCSRGFGRRQRQARPTDSTPRPAAARGPRNMKVTQTQRIPLAAQLGPRPARPALPRIPLGAIDSAPRAWWPPRGIHSSSSCTARKVKITPWCYCAVLLCTVCTVASRPPVCQPHCLALAWRCLAPAALRCLAVTPIRGPGATRCAGTLLHYASALPRRKGN